MGTSPAWLEEKGKINEPLFCKELIAGYPLIFSENRFYDCDGEVSEDIISHGGHVRGFRGIKTKFVPIVT